MVICVSAVDSCDRLAVAVEHRIARGIDDRAVGHQAEPAVARQAWPARCADGEVAVAGNGEVERIAGVRQRPRLLFAPGRAVLRVGDGAVALRRTGVLPSYQPVAELHALGLEARRAGIGDVVRGHVHRALLRDEAGGGDAAGDVHARAARKQRATTAPVITRSHRRPRRAARVALRRMAEQVRSRVIRAPTVRHRSTHPADSAGQRLS